MIVLRLPPYPIDVKYDVPLPNTDYFFSIENDDQTVESYETLTSDSNSQITFTLTDDFIKYDHDYSVSIYESVDDIPGDIILEDV